MNKLMADMPDDFWSGWITLITIVSLLAFCWVVASIYFSKTPDPTAHEPGTEPVWDEDLVEGNKAPPLWWFWMILASLVFSVIYLMLYPGMGSFKGMLNWSQDSRLNSSYESFETMFMPARDAILQSSLGELQNNPSLMEGAERLFSRHCAACHGEDGRGQAFLFPNLMDVDWQWGSSPEQIEQSIRLGRNALMPPWGAALGEAGIQNVADYVLTPASERATDHSGGTQYEQFCSACHGVDGNGKPLLGAPNINDGIWLYGGSVGTIRDVLQNGRNGVMPAFDKRLDDAQIKLLIAFLVR
jgi:cytochrome c oxidase cbb3-type subunit III